MSMSPSGDKSTLVQVIVWCSHNSYFIEAFLCINSGHSIEAGQYHVWRCSGMILITPSDRFLSNLWWILTISILCIEKNVIMQIHSWELLYWWDAYHSCNIWYILFVLCVILCYTGKVTCLCSLELSGLLGQRMQVNNLQRIIRCSTYKACFKRLAFSHQWTTPTERMSKSWPGTISALNVAHIAG